jgi:hypothetical protein
MMTPTARSTTLPFNANALNSEAKLIVSPSRERPSPPEAPGDVRDLALPAWR